LNLFPVSFVVFNLMAKLERERIQGKGNSWEQYLCLLNNSPYFLFSIESQSRYKDEVIRSDQDVWNHKEKIEEKVARVIINDWNILFLNLMDC
jgi:hypothetical protein